MYITHFKVFPLHFFSVILDIKRLYFVCNLNYYIKGLSSEDALRKPNHCKITKIFYIPT